MSMAILEDQEVPKALSSGQVILWSLLWVPFFPPILGTSFFFSKQAPSPRRVSYQVVTVTHETG